MSKGFDLPSNKHLGNSHDYWLAPQKNSKRLTEKEIVMTEKQVSNFNFTSVPQIWDDFKCWFIFSDDGRISCRLSIYNEQPQEAIVSDLYTHESIRKHGGAKAILSFCFDFARDRKCNTISLRSDNDDWVRLWYQRMGFEVESSSLWFTKKFSMKFNFTSQICTTKFQSERLLALGLKKETADMYIFDDEVYIGKPNIDDIPAWSLHRLMCLCPTEINGYDFYVSHDYVHYHDMLTGYDDELVGFFKDNPFDSLIDCIEWLIKEGYFNKEYLEEK